MFMVLVVKSLYNAINRDFVAVGGSRGGDKTVKEDRKPSSRSTVNSRDKGEEAMDWEADTKDVLEKLLRDDVSFISNFCQNLVKVSSFICRFLK